MCKMDPIVNWTDSKLEKNVTRGSLFEIVYLKIKETTKKNTKYCLFPKINK